MHRAGPSQAVSGAHDERSAVERVIRARRATRAFLSKPVAPADIEALLALASWAPSGSNMQPWHVHVLTGQVRDALCAAVCCAFDADAFESREYDYYPSDFFEPYLARRRENGWSLYGLLGIQREEKARMRAQMRRNFTFFDAPVGLIFTVDRRLAQGSWLDFGMFLQNLMLAATARGMATCPQAAWIDFHGVVGQQLGFAEHEQLVCGMALGYADPRAIENELHPARVPLAEFVVYHDGACAG
nr:nitroreductase [Dechloromonas sp.]